MSTGTRVRRWLGRNALRIYGVIAFAYIFTPIAYIAVYSFNQGGKDNLTWRGFTTANWTNPCGAGRNGAIASLRIRPDTARYRAESAPSAHPRFSPSKCCEFQEHDTRGGAWRSSS